MRLKFLIVGIPFLVAMVWPTPRISAAPSQPFHERRILIIPKAGHENEVGNLHRNHRAQVRDRFLALRNIQVLDLPAGVDVSTVVGEYRRSGHVEAAEPDFIRRASVLPNDYYVTNGYQWHLHNVGQYNGRDDADIDAPEAWEITHSASNIVVAVVDTGVRYTHEDLAENIWTNPGEIPGNNIDDDHNGVIDDVHGFSAFGGDVDDPNGHGTHVAGIIGGVGNNEVGISGVAWRVQIMVCKFLNAAGRGYDSDAIKCINYARTNGAHILNCSWGSEEYSSVLATAINSARASGTIVVAAAGNDGLFVISYPAGFAFDNVLSVGATTRTDARSSYSGSGRIWAPGDDIWSTLPYSDSGYGPKTGTSMATPVVAGAAAILRAAFPDERYTNTIERLIASCDSPTVLSAPPYRLNLANALRLIVSSRFFPSRYSGAVPLTVDFSDTSFGKITNRVWSFGDGTFLTNALNPSHTFSSTGLFQIVLTVTATNGLTSSSTQSVRVTESFPYTISQAPYDWITNGLDVVLTNGILSAPQTLLFPFEFYGKSYSQIYMSAYGIAGFLRAGLDTPSVMDLPRTFNPNAIICPYWMWLQATNGATLLSGEYGIAPHRKAVFSWIEVHQINTPTNRFTFQMILHESGHVTMQYREVENVSSFYAGGRFASIGLEDDSGLIAAKYTYRGTPNLVSNGQAIVYMPPDYAPIPPRLRVSNGLSPGVLNLLAYTAPGQNCVVEVSVDLFRWNALATNTVPGSGIFQFTVTSTIPSQRFYRIALP